MFGGKLKDEGGYSCIFSPPLKCKDTPLTISDVSSDLTYGKLMKIKDADKEFSIANIISRIPHIKGIPLWKNYFVVSESICSPSISQNDKDLSKCEVLKDHKMSEFKLTIMPFRGVALDRYAYRQDFDFDAFALHLIEAGALLNIFGIVHKDLHKGNVLVDKHDVPRIIDFNLSIDTRSPLNLRTHSHSYKLTQEPPDATIINAISLNKGYKMDVVIKNICKKSIIKDISLLLNISHDDIFNSITRYYESITSDSEWFLNYWSKIDSWSIGVIIVQIIIIINKDISQTMKNMLKKMCAVNPNERIDCVQALRYLNPENFIVKKYGENWFSKAGYGF